MYRTIKDIESFERDFFKIVNQSFNWFRFISSVEFLKSVIEEEKLEENS